MHEGGDMLQIIKGGARCIRACEGSAFLVLLRRPSI